MLTELAVRDFMFVHAMRLDFSPGFTALTGETGAGKSMMLAALGFALGGRPPPGVIRQGAPEASVAARFELAGDHPVHVFLEARGVRAAPGEALLFRRVMRRTGARGYLNDQPVGAGLLGEAGALLVDMAGQHAALELRDPASARRLVDADRSIAPLKEEVRRRWEVQRALREAAGRLRAGAARAATRRDELDLLLADLTGLGPREGEIATLEARRAQLRTGARYAEALAAARDQIVRGGVETALAAASRLLERASSRLSEEGADASALAAASAALERARIETLEAMSAIEEASAAAEADPGTLESVEARLFALRGAGRRHGVAAEALHDLQQRLAAERAALEAGEGDAAGAEAQAGEAVSAYLAAAAELTRARTLAAERLSRRVAEELKPLRLAGAKLDFIVSRAGEGAAGADGVDRVEALFRSHSGAPALPLGQSASGGELARISLAVALASGAPGRPLAVFDEADVGVGGATAAAIGSRLARLGRTRQVLAVTHSPQVAAAADQQLQAVREPAASGGEQAGVRRLDAAAREEEIARMLAGAQVTGEARAAAVRLLAGA